MHVLIAVSLGNIFSFVHHQVTDSKQTDFLQEYHRGIFRVLLLLLKALYWENSLSVCSEERNYNRDKHFVSPYCVIVPSDEIN